MVYLCQEQDKGQPKLMFGKTIARFRVKYRTENVHLRDIWVLNILHKVFGLNSKRQWSVEGNSIVQHSVMQQDFISSIQKS